MILFWMVLGVVAPCWNAGRVGRRRRKRWRSQSTRGPVDRVVASPGVPIWPALFSDEVQVDLLVQKVSARLDFDSLAKRVRGLGELVEVAVTSPRSCRAEYEMCGRRAPRGCIWAPARGGSEIRRCGRPGRIHENLARKPPASAVLAYSGATAGRDGGCGWPCDAGWGRRLRSRSLIPSRAT